MQRLALLVSGLVLAVLAGCHPDDPELTPPQVQLAIHPEFSSASFMVDPSYPDGSAVVDAQIAVGLDNADPAGGDTDTVTLTRLALVSGSTTVPLAGASFEDGAVDAHTSAVLKYVEGATVTDGDLTALCGVAGVVLRVEVHGVRFGTATGDIPATLQCAKDRRAGELATRALGPNPPHMPCEIDSDDGSVYRLGWDANGRLEIEDDTVRSSTVRTVIQYDDAGQVSDSYRISDGLFSGHMHYAYSDGRVTSSTYDDYRDDPSALSWSWSPEGVLTAGSHVYSLSADGLTVEDQDGDTVSQITFDDPISLTAYATQEPHESAARFHERSERVLVQGQLAGALDVSYSDGDIVSEVTTVSGADGNTFTWKYSCDF